jgi:probable phosphoglycerate mutase
MDAACARRHDRMSEAKSYPQRAFTLPSGATEVKLVRHGASEAAVAGQSFELLGGQANPPLAPEGHDQAQAVAGRLGGTQIDALFVTTLVRTVQTAAPLVAATGLTPTVVEGLREVNLGDWEGGEYRIRFAHGDPLAIRVLTEERWDLIPNAEPQDAFAARVRAGVQAIVDATGPDRVAVAVLHAAVIAEICHQATASRPFAFQAPENGSISRLIVLSDGRWLLRGFNDTTHLNWQPV